MLGKHLVSKTQINKFLLINFYPKNFYISTHFFIIQSSQRVHIYYIAYLFTKVEINVSCDKICCYLCVKRLITCNLPNLFNGDAQSL